MDAGTPGFMNAGTRGELLDRLATASEAAAKNGRPARVAIDGPDAAGKTTLADELADVLRARGREVVRASIDGFHRPREERYRRGASSPEGCYCDTFDPRTDSPVADPTTTAAAHAFLLFDGVFLLRKELIDQWDLRIFVSAAFEKTLERARTRDLALFGSAEEVERRYRDRCTPAQQLYFADARPTDHADIIVHNDDPEHPSWRVRPENGCYG